MQIIRKRLKIIECSSQDVWHYNSDSQTMCHEVCLCIKHRDTIVPK